MDSGRKELLDEAVQVNAEQAAKLVAEYYPNCEMPGDLSERDVFRVAFWARFDVVELLRCM